MKALFVTVASSELFMPVNAWRNNMGPCAHITYDAFGARNDEGIIACAKGYEPDVIFYIGSNSGSGIPSFDTFKKLRDFAPCIQYQSDVEDEAWHPLLRDYRSKGCFDLIVSQTGVKTDLIDMASLIAVDIDAYHGDRAKDTLCGFAGTAGSIDRYKPGISNWDGRDEVLHGLENKVTFRPREPAGDYNGYIDFVKRCLVVLNVSYTGSGKRHHVKWRVLEAAFADCALLEMADSPTSDWFPKDYYFTYATVGDAKRAIMNLRSGEIARKANLFSSFAREHYTPQKIYNRILSELPK